ncbi:MAG: 50S ribosomal protein L6 [Candidatus Omnitrophota bacterium]
MSRIGKLPVALPESVKVAFVDRTLSVEGPKGKLSFTPHPRMDLKLTAGSVSVSAKINSKFEHAIFGTTRAIIANMVKGVTDGYSKELEIRGVGYKAQVADKVLTLYLGFTHPIEYKIPEGIVIETPKPTLVTVKGIDKALVGEVAAQIRDFYRAEPYKGKGVRYVGEYVRKKVGKKVA